MEFISFLAAILIFVICLIVAFKPTKTVSLLGAALILPLLFYILLQ